MVVSEISPMDVDPVFLGFRFVEGDGPFHEKCRFCDEYDDDAFYWTLTRLDEVEFVMCEDCMGAFARAIRKALGQP